MGYFPNLKPLLDEKTFAKSEKLPETTTFKTFGVHPPSRLFTRYTSVFRRADAKG